LPDVLFSHIWILGHAENVPRHIARFQFLYFEKVKIFEKNVEHVGWMFTFVVGFMVSKQGASVSELPAALRRPQKSTPLDFGTWIL